LDKLETLKKFYNYGLKIIRLKPDDKRPAERWGESPKHSLKELEGFLKYNSNFGAVLGDESDGIIVIDLDQPELYHQYFKNVETLVVKTPKKGYHIYLKTSKNQRKIPSYLFKPIDVQGNKSYVVIPPSSINGNSYQVIKDKPIKSVRDPEEFVKEHLKDVIFNKSVDCIDLARKELGEPIVDSGHYTQYNCPFHNDQDTPSFTCYEDGFKCFGCGWSGSAQDFLLKLGKEADEVFNYLEEHGVDINDGEIKLQTKRQKQLQLLCGMLQSKYPMATNAKTSQSYIYYSPRNVWKPIYGDGFFKQLVYETTGHPILDDEVDILIQYIFNPRVEDVDWVSFNNKTVNIETGEVREPNSEIFTTTHINFNYTPDAYSENMDDVLKEILIDESGDGKYKFFFEMLGYFFTGENVYNKMFFLTGKGANGKSTLMAIIRRIFDGYTCSQQLQNLHKDFGLQPLVGKKINIVYDLSSSALTDIGTLKAITGEDDVTINIKNSPQITMKLPTKIIATGNVLPPVQESTYAFYRRVVHLELKNTFDDPNVNLVRELMEDTEGLEWVIYKSIKNYRNVKYEGWSIEEDVESVAESYQKLADPLGWVSDQLFEPGEDDEYLQADTIYNAMKDKLEEEEMAIPKRSRKYYEHINEYAEKDRISIEGNRVRIWRNIRFKYMPKGLAELKGW